jgi:AAHS family 4-hydroxybenzoate transporter-like MFS transporter
MVLITNFFVDGCFAGAQALTTSSFPSPIRGTATGWITGTGRFAGGGVGTAAGGYLLQAGWTAQGISTILAAVMGVGAVGVLLLIQVSRSPSGVTAEPDPVQV